MVKVGMIIREKVIDNITRKKTYHKWRVKKNYPHMVLCADNAGIRTCFSYGDLIIMNIEKQSPELEALKASVDLKNVDAHHKNTTRTGQ